MHTIKKRNIYFRSMFIAILFTYNTMLGAKLKKTHSDDSQRLPIPATYLIGTDGKIAWRQFDPDYKNRSSVADILQALEEMN